MANLAFRRCREKLCFFLSTEERKRGKRCRRVARIRAEEEEILSLNRGKKQRRKKEGEGRERNERLLMALSTKTINFLHVLYALSNIQDFPDYFPDLDACYVCFGWYTIEIFIYISSHEIYLPPSKIGIEWFLSCTRM